MKDGSWAKVFVILIIWSALVYLVVESFFHLNELADFFKLGLYLITAITATAAVWWGFSLDVQLKIGNVVGDAPPRTTGLFARGFALGGAMIALIMVGILGTALTELRTFRTYYHNLQNSLVEVLSAKEDMVPGQVITRDSVQRMAINRSAITDDYVLRKDEEVILGRSPSARIAKSMPILRSQLTPLGETEESANNGRGDTPEPLRGSDGPQP